MDNYLYNGVELPALPEWDKETYPKAIIRSYQGSSKVSTVLFCYSATEQAEGYKDNNGRLYFLIDFPCLFAQYDEQTGTWGNLQHAPNEIFPDKTAYSLSMGEVVWSNTDIYVEYNDFLTGDSVSDQFFASDPVPVGGEPETDLTNIDLYRKINGKPVKLTLYKKLGGKLIPLDEHTKEVKT